MRQPCSESKLPEGDPAGRGVSLDPAIPGTSTFAKPSGEPPRGQGVEDSSIYRVTDADSLLKSQTTPDSIDLQNLHPSYTTPGPVDSPKTKYPNRDGIPNAHNASLVNSVVQLWLLKSAREVQVDLSLPSRIAATLAEIETGLNPKTQLKAKSCSSTLKRADLANLRWIFSVDCGNGPRLVRLKAVRSGKVVALTKMGLFFSCSCPAWRWLGSEFHAKGENYIDGKPRGTASPPNIKDPTRVNRVCKHVAAVLSQVRAWQIPNK